MRISIPDSSFNDPFGIPWHVLDQKNQVVDIPINKFGYAGYAIKIPFHMELLQYVDEKRKEKWIFGDMLSGDYPITEINHTTFHSSQWKIFSEILRIKIEIIYEPNQIIKKDFMIRIPRDKKTEFSNNDPDTIEFESIEND
jgi:hypothetical protein